MAKPEWGAKRICYSCGARYYDLRRSPPVCPKCATQFDPEAFLKSRRGRSVPAEPAAKKVAAVEPVEADDGVIADADEAAIDTDAAESTTDADDFEAEVDDDVDAVIEDTDDLDDSDLNDVTPGGDDDEDR